MPIRINLLAEQQAAEEMRRRDPVKRAIWIGSILVFATLIWGVMLQMRANAARSEMTNLEAALLKDEEASKTVRSKQLLVGDVEKSLHSLRKYSTNRLLWGSTLNAMQGAVVDGIRVISISTDQSFPTNAPAKFFTTNIVVPFTPRPPAWKFWASAPPVIPPTVLAQDAFKTFTNRPPFTTNNLPLTTRSTVSSTNVATGEITVRVEFSTPITATEITTVEIRGKDFGNPPGSLMDLFTRSLTSIPYLRERLHQMEGQGLRYKERPPQARVDASDPISPSTPHIPFTIEMRFQERVFANE
ncbi:MAG: hypothetical protein SFY81_09665 [Verrucomicrobiota bacterium]|nr:hypothetical protein [Verrucomicrobiota bacterium]